MTALSLIKLNPRSRRCRNDMRDPQAMHRTLMAMFPDAVAEQARQELGVLWRLEPAEEPTLLVQSKEMPDLSLLPDGYHSARTKNIDRHLSSVGTGRIVRYRATVNPVRSSRSGGKNTQTVVPFNDQPDWWRGRAERSGLSLLDSPVLVSQPANSLNRSGHRVPIYMIRVDGVAEVGDADTLRSAIESGIGRAKAWGCGLLTIATARM